ncbi:parathyroid hormone [Rana temporaria]|uniref:parathyroid hormone n=1 Tax=Rana temporaria TaxID=8407 RepID=UPI001AACDDAA|nr:parathyroid hormone [Rana temporaria]
MLQEILRDYGYATGDDLRPQTYQDAAMHFITDIAKLGLILCGVSLFSGYEGKPVTRRAISEMQLMHNYGDFRHTLQRQEWLQTKIQNLHPASVSTPQESTPKVAETRPQKPHKKEGKSVENRIRHGSHQNPRTAGKKGHRHSAKPNVDSVFKPDFQ